MFGLIGLMDLLRVPSNKMPLEQRLVTDFLTSPPSGLKGGKTKRKRRTRGTRRNRGTKRRR